MSKSVNFEIIPRPRWPHQPDVRLTLTTRSSYDGRIMQRRQFTVDLNDLKRALRDKGILEQAVPVEIEKAVPEAGQTLLAEIAWYDTLKDLRGGSPNALVMRDKLWSRISKKLGLL
jgi:hypothetical protein